MRKKVDLNWYSNMMLDPHGYDEETRATRWSDEQNSTSTSISLTRNYS